jgi:Mg-chelatase subunit ChlD
MEGIVPVSDTTTPTWRDTTGQQTARQQSLASSSSDGSDGSNSDSEISVGSNEDAARYTNQELHDARGLGKLKHISTNTLMNSLLRKTTKKNTWIFVVDTSSRM